MKSKKILCPFHLYFMPLCYYAYLYWLVVNLNSSLSCSKDLAIETPDKSFKLKKEKQYCIFKTKRTKIRKSQRHYFKSPNHKLHKKEIHFIKKN